MKFEVGMKVIDGYGDIGEVISVSSDYVYGKDFHQPIVVSFNSIPNVCTYSIDGTFNPSNMLPLCNIRPLTPLEKALL